MPFQICPLPIESPLAGRPDEFELGDWRFDPLLRIIPFGAALENDDLMTLHRVFKPHLVFENRRAPFSAPLPDCLFDSFEFEFTEWHGGRPI